jgi:hypothetical protein
MIESEIHHTGKHEIDAEAEERAAERAAEGERPTLDEALALARSAREEHLELPEEPWPLIELERCEISFLINVTGINDLAEALDVAAGSLGRYGMDAFYILATDPDSGRQWIINDGKVMDADEATEELERQRDELMKG